MTTTTPARDSVADAVGAPEVVGLLAAGRLLGMGCTKAYRLANANAFPRRVMRIGGRYASRYADCGRYSTPPTRTAVAVRQARRDNS